MRTLLGYFLNILLVLMLYLLISLFFNEWTTVEGFNQKMDKTISIDKTTLSETSYFTDNQGAIISEVINDGEDRIYLSDKEIPSFLKDLFIVSEDRNFYEHAGIDASAISRALIVNSQSDSIEQGGSTITQQLARNLYLTTEKTYNRKLTELLYSYQLERTLSKSEILERYVNVIYFQNGAYGIEAASQLYFTKSAIELSKAELAFLAAIPNNPTLYNPLTNFDNTKGRQERLLNQMVEAGKITKSEYSKIILEPITLKIRTRPDYYPDYVDYANKEFKELVAVSEGLAVKLESTDVSIQQTAQKQLDQKVGQLLKSGITIHTALDVTIQKRSQTALQTQLTKTSIEGASVVIQHHTHQLVSMIGGMHYKKNSFNRAYQSYRQPGSAIKPLLVYAPYIEESGASLTETISGATYCKNGYCPQNYGGAAYGKVSLKKAFSQSYNTPAIRLLEKNGIDRSFAYLEPFQFQKVSNKDHILAAAVGGFTYGVSPLELTNAYTSFQDGTYQPARAITKVTDKTGKVIYQWNENATKIWNGKTVTKMRELLHEVVVSGTAKKASVSSTYIGGKTGTTNDVKDLWFVGLTETYTTGVWVGYDQPKNMEAIQSTAPHLLIWKKINQ